MDRHVGFRTGFLPDRDVGYRVISYAVLLSCIRCSTRLMRTSPRISWKYHLAFSCRWNIPADHAKQFIVMWPRLEFSPFLMNIFITSWYKWLCFFFFFNSGLWRLDWTESTVLMKQKTTKRRRHGPRKRPQSSPIQREFSSPSRYLGWRCASVLREWGWHLLYRPCRMNKALSRRS